MSIFLEYSFMQNVNLWSEGLRTIVRTPGFGATLLYCKIKTDYSLSNTHVAMILRSGEVQGMRFSQSCRVSGPRTRDGRFAYQRKERNRLVLNPCIRSFEGSFSNEDRGAEQTDVSMHADIAERKRLWMAAIKPPMYSVGIVPVLVSVRLGTFHA